ncbi:piggyBac transposable element-derived protein 3-like [Rhopalosiphum padi]|uniref:piggyBac transposable element-derived protein 3-like n=1 Tax=Rhopalosiphum padi TaxID=40932 RepID=UPI00298E06EA|nr:piggyBac transposable element-derived protein 3-like [Rhopalosiphum padi]
MAKGLREHEIFDLLCDGNVSELDFSDEETEDQFDNEELQRLLNDFEQWDDQDELNETEKIPKNNIDKFIKVRPLYDAINKKCNSLPVERRLSVDEQMVPYKGHLQMKQYVKGKPCPWGIKAFLLCGESGMVYNILLYQGATTELDTSTQKQFGLGASVVLHLTKHLEKNRHFLFFDNFFSTFNLFEQLQANQIYSVGTIRTNRFANPPLLTDKQLAKMGRGTAFEISTNMENCNLCMVKWYDTRSVTLVSNYIGSGQLDTVRRWDKKLKMYVNIERPEIITAYNTSMGGVDKVDQLISYYRTFIRSKKWTLRMIVHAFDLIVVNCWIQYKKDADHYNVNKNKRKDLLHFRMALAENLIKVGQNVPIKRRGRPRADTGDNNEVSTIPKVRKVDSSQPTDDVRKDKFDHFPEFDTKGHTSRCKNPGCKRKTHIFCIKCNIHLCLDGTSNCFYNFHQ